MSGFQLQQDQPLASASTSTSRDACPDADGGAGQEDAKEQVMQARMQQDLEGAVAELLKRNRDVFEKIINHSFPRKLGDGTASLDGFRYYMIQDMKYLETCAQLKMIAAGESHDFEEVRGFFPRHKRSLEYVDNLKTICITKLGVPASIIEATPQSDELRTSERFYKLALHDRHEEALFGYYLVLLPCILSYWKIANRLMHATSTVKNVVYHTTWTEENDDDSSVVKYAKFINENIAAKGGVDQWNHIFNIACMLEAQLFDTGLQRHTVFRIIPDGTYFIYNSSHERVVLAIQKVEGSLQSPLDRSSVVGIDKTGGDNEKVIEMYCSLFVLKLTHCTVAGPCDQRWIYVPKLGDSSLSWDFLRRPPNLASCFQAILLVG
ncbi:hypothetical protein EV401DRAFT_429959 [Pisolithus croceorrhizus]|nr:hypothetical protein EV401DRAFT_429959 [Pisolithus croceorrhizus]